MLEYVQALCEQEGVAVEAGVLPLVVRGGGGSPRDTLSLLDQLIAGSEPSEGSGNVSVRYERAVALLGYTHAELLDEVVDAFAASDAAAAFASVDRVVQTGQDPRRFVDDLLERLRDLIIVAATGQGAAAVLRGTSAEDLARMQRQADAFGAARLSRTADIVIGTLDDMTGATSPRLQLELMVARVLSRGADAAPAAAPATAVSVAQAPAAIVERAAPTVAEPSRAPAVVEQAPREQAPVAQTPAAQAPVAQTPAAQAPVAPAPAPAAPAPAAPAPAAPGPVTLQRMRDAWPEVLARLEDISRTSWLLASNAEVAGLDDDVLTLAFASQADVAKFKQRAAGGGPSEDLRQAILAVLGIRVKYLAKYDGPAPGRDAAPAAAPAPSGPASAPRASAPARASTPAAAAPVTEWAVAPIPTDADAPPPDPGPAAPPAGSAQFAVDDEPEDAARLRTATLAPVREGEVLGDEGEPEAEAGAPVPPIVAPPLPPVTTMRNDGVQRYGEAVVRQVLGATFVREEPYEPPTRFS
jgi:DNA polymerase-3 subunit gamma/tau